MDLFFRKYVKPLFVTYSESFKTIFSDIPHPLSLILDFNFHISIRKLEGYG